MTAVKHHILQHMPVFLFKESVRRSPSFLLIQIAVL